MAGRFVSAMPWRDRSIVSNILLFILLGLGPGALFAAMALGIVLTYRGCGAINFATGAIAVLGAFVFFGLRTGGYLFLPPIPFAPHQINFGAPWSTGPALLVSLAVCALSGVLLDALVWRPLRYATPLSKLLASLGVFITIQAMLVLRFPAASNSAPAVLPQRTIHLLGTAMPVAGLLSAALVVGVGIVLGVAYRYSRFGLATRAAQESEADAVLAGLSPRALSMVNTVLACIVAGGFGIVVASQSSLDTTTIPLAVIPALGAALLARFTSFRVAVVAGLAMGVIQSLVIYAQSLSWFPLDANGQALPGINDLIFFLIIVVAMFLRGKRLPQRGMLVEQRLPRAPAARHVTRSATLATAVAVVALLVLPFDYRQALTNSMIGTLICLSFVVLTGFVGQISLLQIGLAGVSGFITAKLGANVGLGFPLTMVAGAAVATLMGLVVASSAFRVRGVSLAIVTLAAAIALETFGFLDVRWGGGELALVVPSPTLFGINLGPTAHFPISGGKAPTPVFGLVCVAIVLAACLFVANLRRSRVGERMLAVRSNERAAAAAGINVRSVKFVAFGISAMLAGLAGSLNAYNLGSVSEAAFDPLVALELVAFAYVGGITTVKGAILGGLGVTGGLLAQVLSSSLGIPGSYQIFVGGLGLIFILARHPEGMAGVTPDPRGALRRANRLIRSIPATVSAARAGVR